MDEKAGLRGQRETEGRTLLNLRILGVGLILLCALVAFTVHVSRPGIEADLAVRAAERLDAIGESWATARFSGRDATLIGEALAHEPRDKVRGAIESLSGVGSVTDATTLLPERRPFTFSVIRDGPRVQLEGYVPSRYALARIAAAVKGLPPGLEVRGLDQLVRARGAPPGDFSSVVIFALDALMRVQSGRITLSDDMLSIEGRAPDLAAYNALRLTMSEPLPQDFRLARFAVRPPAASPYLWSAAREGRAVVVRGHVPSEEVRQQVLAALRAAMPEAGISDHTDLADGAPSLDRWLAAVRFAANQLALMPTGQVSLSNTSIYLEGAASTFPIYDALSAARRAPPEGFQVVRFSVEPPVAAPFIWRVSRQGGQAQISGYAPSEDARRVMGDAVKALFAGVQVSDQVRLASGGPPSDIWTAAVTFALTQVSRMAQGEASVLTGAVTLSGEAADSASYASLRDALKAPPPGVKVDASRVLPPVISPYVFAVRTEESGVTLSGFFPDDAVHARLLETVGRLFPGVRVNDVTAVGAGAPPRFADAAIAALAPLARLETGDLRFSDGQVSLSGTDRYPAAGAQIEAELKAALPKGFAMDLAVEAPPASLPVGPRECLKLLTDATARGLVFLPGGQPGPGSMPALDRLAQAALRCPPLALQGAQGAAVPDPVAAIQGEAIRAHLVAAGVPASHVSWMADFGGEGAESLTVAGVRISVRPQ